MTKNWLKTMVVLGLCAMGIGLTFSAFSSSTTNSGNSFSSGTVSISDNSGGTAMWTVSNAVPNTQTVDCIKVTYTGTLPASVHLYVSSSSGNLGQYLNFSVDQVTYSGTAPTFPGCGSPASSTNLYNGNLNSFSTTYTNFSNGLAAFPGSQTQWNQNDAVYYRFTVTLQNNNSAQGQSATTAFTWEADNQ